MPIPEEMLDEYGIPNIELGDNEELDGVGNSQDVNVDSLYDSVFNDDESHEGENVSQEENKTGDEEKGNEDEQADKTNHTPNGDFHELSSKALFTEEGEINSEKVSDFFLNDSKSFLSFKAEPEIVPPAKEFKQVDHVAQYKEKIDSIVDGWDGVVTHLVNDQGLTHEQALNTVGAHLSSLKAQLAQQQQIDEERKQLNSEYRDELQSIREEKIDSIINRNIAELGSTCNDMIPGVDGSTALNHFVLDPKYGGPMVEQMFASANPNFAKLPPEEQESTRGKWFRSFQSNKRSLALVADYGKSRWLVSQLPSIIEKAQRVGAGKLTAQKEAVSGGVSNLGNSQSATLNPELSEFLGFDSVS